MKLNQSSASESLVNEHESDDNSFVKSIKSKPIVDTTNLSVLCDKTADGEDKNDDEIAALRSEQQSLTESLAQSAQRKSTMTSKTSDTRHFQKTRSFSAVEDTPDKKVISNQLNTIPDFPLKDVHHSRSDQLETQSMQQSNTSGELDSKLVTSSSTVVDHSELMKCEDNSSSSSNRPPMMSGDTLIMQFDYFSNDQPMSLQHDPRSNSSNQRNDNQMRKSGRDLTELGSDFARNDDKFDRTKTSRIMSSRPRLDIVIFNTPISNPFLPLSLYDLLLTLSVSPYLTSKPLILTYSQI